MLKDKSIVITGAARGFGAAIARHCVDLGASVVIADVLADAGTRVAEELGRAARFCHLDVTRVESWQSMLETIENSGTGLHGLVNNAGINRAAPMSEITLEDYSQVVAVNQVGTFLGMKLCAPLLASSSPASIVNVSSIAGLVGMKNLIAYSATKFAIRGMTKVAALELGPAGVRVNSVHPGFFETDLTRAGGGGRSDIDRGQLAATLPLRRQGDVLDVADAVAFLLSDQSRYVTGSELVIDGGAVAGLDV